LVVKTSGKGSTVSVVEEGGETKLTERVEGESTDLVVISPSKAVFF
jgi:uncharacterized protein GlcG (DUF336 family)